MRSKMSIKGHPIHPGLIPFPFAFLIGAFLFDLTGTVLQRPGWWTTAGHLRIAGVIMGLVAAIPGIIDYLWTVPPDSTGKTRAARHGLINSLSLAVFAAAWLLRDPDVAPGMMLLGAEGIGALLISCGAWMGGTLVGRNQIGVDHRYAEAGKWNEESFEAEPGKPIAVAKTGELEVNQMKLLRVNGRRIVLARSDEGYLAFQDRCTHRGASLADGVLICSTVQCPWHGSQFDVRTGAVKAGPAKEELTLYGVEARGGEIRLIL